MLTTAGPSREILALNMHPMQKAIAKEELFKAVERALVSAVTQVRVPLASAPPLLPCTSFMSLALPFVLVQYC